MATAHAKNRAPSAAKRWLSCPQSALITPMYPNDNTDASLKGDYWHELMETQIVFGTLPINADPDAAEAMQSLYDYVVKRIAEMGGPGKVTVLVEQRLDIPETGEFGTVDIVLVGEREIEVIDEKSGYVPVHVKMNAQMMVYLLGVIGKYGTRKKYRLTIHQPNYDHIDGAIRSFEPSDDDIEWVRTEIAYSIKNENICAAGKHCKETYCPHRGTCEAFMAYVQKDLMLGWHTSEVRSITDEQLSTALDAADELSGWRNELRMEAMRRIMNMNREVHGYKVVKGRRDRAITKPRELVHAVHGLMGQEWSLKLFPNIEWAGMALSGILSGNEGELTDEVLKFLGTAKHVEDVLKQYARAMGLPSGGWKKLYENVVGEFIRESANGLTLDKAIDGRPAHKRGSEFGTIPAPQLGQDVTII